MFFLTKKERFFLFLFSLCLFLGIIVDISFKKYPELKDIVNLVEGDRLINKYDVNKATKDELISIPFIGEYTAQAIIVYRENTGGIQSLDELKNIRGIREKNYQKFVKYLKVTHEK